MLWYGYVCYFIVTASVIISVHNIAITVRVLDSPNRYITSTTYYYIILNFTLLHYITLHYIQLYYDTLQHITFIGY